MSNKLLKRAIDRLEQFTKKEVEKLVRLQIAEADMLDAILEESPIGHLLLKNKIIRSDRIGYYEWSNNKLHSNAL